VARARLDRWRRIALESLKQCRRNFEMELAAPVTAREFLGRPRQDGEDRWLLHPDGEPLPRRLGDWGTGADQPGARGALPEAVVAAIGPEGGWSEAEVRAAESGGFTRAALGENILRTETAALAALALLQARYHWTREA
jgi:16S rRNA (uracil1498-N3)-methyltransferase